MSACCQDKSGAYSYSWETDNFAVYMRQIHFIGMYQSQKKTCLILTAGSEQIPADHFVCGNLVTHKLIFLLLLCVSKKLNWIWSQKINNFWQAYRAQLLTLIPFWRFWSQFEDSRCEWGLRSMPTQMRRKLKCYFYKSSCACCRHLRSLHLTAVLKRLLKKQFIRDAYVSSASLEILKKWKVCQVIISISSAVSLIYFFKLLGS